jgi:hypothetical protein
MPQNSQHRFIQEAFDLFERKCFRPNASQEQRKELRTAFFLSKRTQGGIQRLLTFVLRKHLVCLRGLAQFAGYRPRAAGRGPQGEGDRLGGYGAAMTEEQKRVFNALETCRFMPGTFEKRFVRTLAEHFLDRELSEKQETMLWHIAFSWRKQMPHGMRDLISVRSGRIGSRSRTERFTNQQMDELYRGWTRKPKKEEA